LECGHGLAPSIREASTTPPMIEYPVSALQVSALRPYWRKLLVEHKLVRLHSE
jgi:hypothetical protein